MANDDGMDDLLREMQRAFGASSITTTASSSAESSSASQPASASSIADSPAATSSAASLRPPFLPYLVSNSHTTGTPVPPPPSYPPLIISSSLPIHTCPPSTKTCSLEAVLLSPDLLPFILLPLTHHTRSLLSLRLVCSLWNSVIRTAPEIRLTFFALPMWKWPAEDFLLLDLGAKGVGRAVTIEKGAEVDKGRWIEVGMSRKAAQRILPERKASGRAVRRVNGISRRVADVEEDGWRRAYEGWRYEDLFVTQPPILGMQAFIKEVPAAEDDGENEDADNEDDDSTVRSPKAKISCDAGITLGFLAETTLSLLCGRDGGSGTDPGEGSSSGVVSEEAEDGDGRRVVFKAIVSFCAPKVAVRKRGVVRTVTSFG